MGRPHLNPISDLWQPTSWLQQPGKWTYNLMHKSATTRSHAYLQCTRPTYTYSMVYSKMNCHLHVHGPIRRWSLYCLIQQSYIIWKMMFVMITGGEYCNFHLVNSREISSQVSQTNMTRMFSVLCFMTRVLWHKHTRMRSTSTAQTTRYTWSLTAEDQAYILDLVKA